MTGMLVVEPRKSFEKVFKKDLTNAVGESIL